MEFKPTHLLRKEQACIYFLSVGNWAVNRGLNMSPGRQQDFFCMTDYLIFFFFLSFLSCILTNSHPITVFCESEKKVPNFNFAILHLLKQTLLEINPL